MILTEPDTPLNYAYHVGSFNLLGAGLPAPVFLLQVTMPSKSDYRAAFRGLMFYMVNFFIIKWLSPIVGHSDSLTARISNWYESRPTYSALAILRAVILCNRLKIIGAGHSDTLSPKVLTHYDYFLRK